MKTKTKPISREWIRYAKSLYWGNQTKTTVWDDKTIDTQEKRRRVRLHLEDERELYTGSLITIKRVLSTLR